MGHETRPMLTTTEPNVKVCSFENPKMVTMLVQQVSNSIQIEFPAYQGKKNTNTDSDDKASDCHN